MRVAHGSHRLVRRLVIRLKTNKGSHTQEDKAWDRIADAIDLKFGVEKHGKLTRPIEGAPDLTQHVSFIIFSRDGKRFKLERIQGPAIIDKKTIGARRAGAEVRQQYVYDPDEIAFRTIMLREDGDDWVEVDPSTLGL